MTTLVRRVLVASVEWPCEDVTIGVGIYGLSLRLECGERCAFMIPEDCEHLIPGGWCHLKNFFLAGDAGCFHCIDACFVLGW
jgi:hypothetical protein